MLCSALTAGTFLLRRQKKGTKEKATPSSAPRLRRGSLRYSPSRAAAQLAPSGLRQCSPNSPGLFALLGAPQGENQHRLPWQRIGVQIPWKALSNAALGGVLGEHCLRAVGPSCAAPAQGE